jgi:uracil-DNA glycosylase family 4
MEPMLDVIQLDRDKTCTRCNLHEECKTVCIPTTLYGLVRNQQAGGHVKTSMPTRAVLIIGEAPGGMEDLKDQPFVGPSGHILRKLYIDFFKLDEKADVYCGNAVRCRPPGNRTPNKTQMKACHSFLLADIVQLQREYDEVLVLAVGGAAARVVWGVSLTKAFLKQGDFTDWYNLIKNPDPVPEPCRVFSTYHPAFIRREPSSGLAVKRHVQMLADYLDGKLEYELDDLLDISIAPMPPRYKLGRLSLDIETYGIVKGCPKQRFYHPKLSTRRDFAGMKDLIQTCGLTWRDPDGQLTHCIFFMDDVNHRRRLWAWLRKCRKEVDFEFLLGQNVVFDLMYLRYVYPEARILLEDPLPIMDLMIFNYLHDESRPEKSLKALAPLFRVSKYGDTKVNGEYKRYADRRIPELIQYNCQDTASTLRIAEKLMSEIRGFYGADTKKLSPFCMKWYSQLLWLIVWMQENGIKMDKSELDLLFARNEKALNAIMRAGRELYDMPLRGKGSEKAKRLMMDDAVAIVDQTNELPELELTDKKKEVRFSADNRNALMDLLDREVPIYKQLKLFGAYQDVSGLMDRYLYPLLVGGGKKHDNKASVLLNGFCYPRWFPVPSEFEDRSTGGTKQARIVAKGPPCQTFPPVVKRTIIGRFPMGWMVWFDYSQIELRVAALLSNDPPMMQAFLENVDLHRQTAMLMFGDDIVNHPQFKTTHRQAGKVFNFRALYRGGVRKAQVSLMKDHGIHLGITEIANIDNAFWKRHHVLRGWQEELMVFVQRRGFYELPLIGQSRLFLGGKKAREKKLNEIVNLPVQAIAADIMLSAQYALWSAFRKAGLQAVVPCNVYDSASIECPKYEIHRVRRIMAEVLPNPPFYQALCAELGRTLPLEYEVKEKRVTA